MKKIITSIILLLTFLSLAYSQCNDFYKQTPNGTNIKACTDGGWAPWQVALADQQTRAYAIYVYEGGNNSYNCHANAWHVSEGGDKVWINNMNTEANNVDNYWNDGSYIEVASQPASMANVKVFYGSTTSLKDHSAITTSDPNVFISKMGCGVLCSHLKTNSPYDNSSMRYFVRDVDINGSLFLCNSNTITYTSLSFVNCTYNWSYDTNRLNYVSGQGTNNFQVAPKSPLVLGQAWVKLSLVINLSTPITREVTKNVWVGSPVIANISGPTTVGKNEPASYTAQLSLDSNPDSYFWTTSPSAGVSISTDGRYASIMFTNSGGYQVVARAHNSCGWSDYAITWVNVPDGYYLAIYPNPATSEATIELKNPSKEKVAENLEWEFDVYDSMQGMKEKKTMLINKETKINTSGWKDGVYIVRAKIGDKTISEKLVVKH